MTNDTNVTGYVAHMWHCGDWCNCRQPRILLRYGKRWSDYKDVEKGDWISEPEESEWKSQREWLVSKAKEYKCTNLSDVIKRFGESPV